MKKFFSKSLRWITVAGTVWLLLFLAAGTLHRAGYNALLEGDTDRAVSALKLVPAFEPGFFIHRGAMVKQKFVAAFKDTASIIDTRLEWTFDAGGPVMSSPEVASRTVFIGSMDGRLYAIGINPE